MWALGQSLPISQNLQGHHLSSAPDTSSLKQATNHGAHLQAAVASSAHCRKLSIDPTGSANDSKTLRDNEAAGHDWVAAQVLRELTHTFTHKHADWVCVCVWNEVRGESEALQVGVGV